MMDAFDVVLGTAHRTTASRSPSPEIERPDNDLFKLDSCKDGGFMAFEPTASNGYAAVLYAREAGRQPDIHSGIRRHLQCRGHGNTDRPGRAGRRRDPRAATVSEAMTWEHKSVSLTPTKRWQDSANEDTAKLGWPLRVYVNTPLKAQVFIDNIVVKDAKRQNRSLAGLCNIGNQGCSHLARRQRHSYPQGLCALQRGRSARLQRDYQRRL